MFRWKLLLANGHYGEDPDADQPIQERFLLESLREKFLIKLSKEKFALAGENHFAVVAGLETDLSSGHFCGNWPALRRNSLSAPAHLVKVGHLAEAVGCSCEYNCALRHGNLRAGRSPRSMRLHPLPVLDGYP